MKKIGSLLLALLLCFSFAGCKGKGKETSSGDAVDLSYYLSAGLFKESSYGLKTDPKQIEEDNRDGIPSLDGHVDEKIPLEKQSDQTGYHYTIGAFTYYVKQGRENEGVAFVVNYDTAYDFVVGEATEYDVKTAFSDYKPTQRTAEEKDLFFFVFEMQDCKILSYTLNNNRLDFYFDNGVLLCSTLCNTAVW